MVEIRRYNQQIGSLPQVEFTTAPARQVREAAELQGRRARESEERAIENTYLRSQKTLIQEFDRIEKQYQNDPDNMREAIDNFRSSFLDEVFDSELRGRLDLQIEKSASVSIAKATAGRQAIIDDQAAFEMLDSIDAIGAEIQGLSGDLFSGNQSVSLQSQAKLQEIIDRAKRILTQTSSDGTPLFTANQRFAALTGLKDQALEGGVMAWLDRQPNKSAALKQFESGALKIQLPDGKGGMETINVRDSLSPQIERTIRAEAKRQINEQEAKIKAQVQDDARLISNIYAVGQKVDPQKINETKRLAAAVGLNDLAENLTFIEQTYDETQEFILNKNLSEQFAEYQDAQKALSAPNANEKDLMKYKALQEAYTDKIKKLTSDPVAYYESIGAMREYNNIDFSNPEKFAYEIDQRRVSAATIKNRDGIMIPLLKKSEIDFINETYKTGTPAQSAVLLDGISKTFSSDERRLIAQQMSTNAPLVAAALASDRDTMLAILEGGKTQGEVTAGAVRESVNNKIGGRIFDAENIEGVHSAVYAAYKKLAIDAGETSDVVDDKLLDDAINMIIGEPADISIGGPLSNIFSYKDGNKYRTERELEKTFKSIDDQFLASSGGFPMAADGLPITADDIIKKGQFVTAGDGKYIIRIPGMGDLMTRTGNLYIIDARKLEQYRSTKIRAK